MATFYITNNTQLSNVIYKQIVHSLLKYLSEKIVDIIKDNLANSDISTNTLQRSVTYQLNNSGKSSTIYVDYAYAQSFATDPEFDNGELVEWGHLTNTFDGNGGSAYSQFWNGQLISFKLAQWLESGGSGNKGNQPISASHWFSKTVNYVSSNLSMWVKNYLETAMKIFR